MFRDKIHTPVTEYAQVRLQDHPDVALFVTPDGQVSLDLEWAKESYTDPTNPTVSLLGHDVRVAALMYFAAHKTPATLDMLLNVRLEPVDGNPRNLVPDNIRAEPYPDSMMRTLEPLDNQRARLIPYLEDYMVTEEGRVYMRSWDAEVIPSKKTDDGTFFPVKHPAKNEGLEVSLSQLLHLAGWTGGGVLGMETDPALA